MSHSQNNEEKLILDYFGQEVGTFADLGANDGRTLSNTHACALRGWSGVCVEPSVNAFKRLHELYAGNPKIELHQIAVCEGNGLSILHESTEHLGTGDTGLLSTRVLGERDKWASTNTKFIPTTVECVTFAELLDRSAYKTFDLISIDIEGLDLQVLEQIDLTEVGCRMVIVEVNERDIEPYVTHCAQHGMRVLARNAENLILVR